MLIPQINTKFPVLNRPLRAFFVGMDQLKQNIEEITSKIAESKGIFLVDLIIRGHERNRVIEVFIDSEKNVSANDCAEISRMLVERIDNQNLLSGPYRLDVSTPGVDRPLLFLKQFPKHLNRKFEVEFKKDGETEKIEEKLKAIEEETLVFGEKSEYRINFNDIIKAKVIVSFS